MKMSDKHKSASPSAVEVKNQRKVISIEEKLDSVSRLEKGDWIFEICHNVRRAHISVHTVCDNADRITESAKPGPKTLVCAARRIIVLSESTVPKTMDVSLLHFYCIANN
jgi:IS30 family transposase